MESKIAIEYRRIKRSSDVDAQAFELGRQLMNLGREVSCCRMTLDGPHGTRSVIATIEITVPGTQIYADSRGAKTTPSSSISVALYDAFTDAKRQLQRLPALALCGSVTDMTSMGGYNSLPFV